MYAMLVASPLGFVFACGEEVVNHCSYWGAVASDGRC
jgi:hypothetical protein